MPPAGHGMSEEVLRKILISSFSHSAGPPVLGRTRLTLPLERYINRHFNRYGRGLHALFFFGARIRYSWPYLLPKGVLALEAGFGTGAHVLACVAWLIRLYSSSFSPMALVDPLHASISVSFITSPRGNFPAGKGDHVIIDSKVPGAVQGHQLEADYQEWKEAHAKQCAGQEDKFPYRCYIRKRHDFRTLSRCDSILFVLAWVRESAASQRGQQAEKCCALGAHTSKRRGQNGETCVKISRLRPDILSMLRDREVQKFLQKQVRLCQETQLNISNMLCPTPKCQDPPSNILCPTAKCQDPPPSMLCPTAKCQGQKEWVTYAANALFISLLISKRQDLFSYQRGGELYCMHTILSFLPDARTRKKGISVLRMHQTLLFLLLPITEPV
eukprot:1161954-Pelagomonas_calceolata.AAC.13